MVIVGVALIVVVSGVCSCSITHTVAAVMIRSLLRAIVGVNIVTTFGVFVLLRIVTSQVTRSIIVVVLMNLAVDFLQFWAAFSCYSGGCSGSGLAWVERWNGKVKVRIPPTALLVVVITTMTTSVVGTLRYFLIHHFSVQHWNKLRGLAIGFGWGSDGYGCHGCGCGRGCKSGDGGSGSSV